MKEGEIIHGFRVTRIRKPSELDAEMIEMIYEKTGTELVFLKRDDDNRSFGIAFRTVPEDSTGVFHIIEHSVLCGSRKYPVKEPFVELLKSSLNTFLNAMTYNDKTVYPVASRNEQDFFNLVDVYMDAVLHPSILHTPEIFLQEGWHYEVDEEGNPSVSGVVFNEMKGAYSSVEDYTEEKIMSLLFPDTCYGKDSGGDPAVIPDLTYEGFLAAHKKFYHPSNARIFADGNIDIERLLSLLDGFLCDYEKEPPLPEIPLQTPVKPRSVTLPYEVTDKDTEGKVRVVFGFLGFSYSEKRTHFALSVIASVLAGTNESPLKAALLDAGLCEDVDMQISTGTEQSFFTIEVINTEESKIEEIEKTVFRVLTEAAEHLDEKRLAAALNQREFFLRERDYGTEPRGIVFGLSMLESWLYGGDPIDGLIFDDDLAFLRAHLSDGYFEEQLKRAFLDNPSRVKLTMTPSLTLAEERKKEENRRYLSRLSPLNEEKLAALKKAEKALKAFQSTPDTEAALATLPTLKLSDLDPLPDRIPTRIDTIDGTTVLYHDIATDGILYVDVYFDVSDCEKDDLPLLAPLGCLLGNVATDRHTALKLQDLITSELGFFAFTPVTAAPNGDAGKTKIYLHMSAGILENKFDSLLTILDEVISGSAPTCEDLKKYFRQMKIAGEEYLSSAGHQVALGRIGSYLTADGFANEKIRGFDATGWLARCKDADLPAILERIRAMIGKYFTRARAVVSLSGRSDEASARRLIGVLPSGSYTPVVFTEKRNGVCREGIAVAAQTSFAVLGGFTPEYHGAFAVLRNLCSYEYLWNKVRVQNGAYGSGFLARVSGVLADYSYRDPKPARSLSVYRGMTDFVRSYVRENDFTRFVIGASAQAALSPRASAIVANTRYLCGLTFEKECEYRRQLLATTREDLLRCADAIDAAFADGHFAVVGPRTALASLPDAPVILSLSE